MLIFPLSFPKLMSFNKCRGISDSTYIIQEKHASLQNKQIHLQILGHDMKIPTCHSAS